MAVLGALVALGGCRPELPELEVVEAVEIPTTAATSLHVAADGRIWIGEPSRFLVLESPGTYLIVPVPGGAPPRVIQEAAGVLLATTGSETFLFDATSGELLATGSVSGRPFLDVRTRWVFGAVDNGAVLIYDTTELSLVSAWAALGASSGPLTGSPQGDRIYQALDTGGTGTILTRDVQTGRILRRASFQAPFATLLSDPAGRLFGLLGDERESALISLRPWGGELELRWRERIPGAAADARLRLSHDGGRLAILLDTEKENGLRMFDAETGKPLGHLLDSPLDAAFDPAGRLLLLHPGELRVVRETTQ